MEMRRDRASRTQHVELETAACPYRTRFLELANQAGFRPEQRLPNFTFQDRKLEDFIHLTSSSDSGLTRATQIWNSGRDGKLFNRLKQSKAEKLEAGLKAIDAALRRMIEDGTEFGQVAPRLIQIIVNETKDTNRLGIQLSELLKLAITYGDRRMCTFLVICSPPHVLLEAMITAISMNKINIMRELLEAGFDPNLLDGKAAEMLLEDVERVATVLRSPIRVSGKTIKTWLSSSSLSTPVEVLSKLLRHLYDQHYDRTRTLCHFIYEDDPNGLLSILDATWHWKPPDLNALSKAIVHEAPLTFENAIIMVEALICASMTKRTPSDMEFPRFETPMLGSHYKIATNSQQLAAQIVGIMSRDVIAVLNSQTYLKETCALTPIIEAENVLLLQTVLEYPITAKTVDLAFPLLRGISKEPRLIMTELLLQKHPVSESTLSRALQEAVCDYSTAHDEALIDVLLAEEANATVKLSAILRVLQNDDLKVFRRIIGRFKTKASTGDILVQIMAMKSRSRRREFMDAVTSQDAAVRIVLPHLQDVIGTLVQECLFDEMLDEVEISVNAALLFKCLDLCQAFTSIQIDKEIIVPAMLLQNLKPFEVVLREWSPSRSCISQCIRTAIDRPFKDDQVRANRIRLLLDHAGEDFDFGSEYLRLHLDACAQANPNGSYWPMSTFDCLMATKLVFDDDFEYCLQSAAALFAHTLVKLLLDQAPTPAMVDRALEATLAVSATKFAKIGLVEAPCVASTEELEKICLTLRKAGANPNYNNGMGIISAIFMDSSTLVETLITDAVLSHATIHAIWDLIGDNFSPAKKTLTVEWMLDNRPWLLCAVDKCLKTVVIDGDLKLCRLFLRYRPHQVQCQRGAPCSLIDVSNSLASGPQKSASFRESLKIAATDGKALIFSELVKDSVDVDFDILDLVEHAIKDSESMLWAIYQRVPYWILQGRYERAFVQLAGAGHAYGCRLFLALVHRQRTDPFFHGSLCPLPRGTVYEAWKAIWLSFFGKKIDECTTINTLRALQRTGICRNHKIMNYSLNRLIASNMSSTKLFGFLLENGASVSPAETCYGITAAQALCPELVSALFQRLPDGKPKAATLCFTQFIDNKVTGRSIPSSCRSSRPPSRTQLPQFVTDVTTYGDGSKSEIWDDNLVWDLLDWDSEDWTSTHSRPLRFSTSGGHRFSPQVPDGWKFDDGALVSWGLKDYNLESAEIKVLRVLLSHGVSIEAARGALEYVCDRIYLNTSRNRSIAELLIQMPGILADEGGWSPLSSICSRGDLKMCKMALKHFMSRSYRLQPLLTGLVRKDQGDLEYQSIDPFDFKSIIDELIAPYRQDDVIFSADEFLQIFQSMLGREGAWHTPRSWDHFWEPICDHMLFVTATEDDLWSQHEIYQTFIYDQLATSESSGLAVSNDILRSLMRWMKTDFSITDMNRRRNRTKSSFFCAIQGNRHEIVPDLIALGASRGLTDYAGKSPLFHACYVSTLEKFFHHFASIDMPRNDGSLHEVAISNKPEFLKILLSYGHDPNFRSSHHCGRTVLEELCLRHAENPKAYEFRQEVSFCHGDRKILGGLPSSPGQMMEGVIQRGGQTKEEMIKLLINAGAQFQTDPLIRGMKQPIFLAIDNGQSGIYELLYILLRVLVISSTSANDLRNQCLFLDMDGRVLSPLTYLEEQCPTSTKGEIAKLEMLRLMRSYGIKAKLYRLEGPQPADAVGVPPELLRAEEERKEKERKAEEARLVEEERKRQITLQIEEAERVRELVLGKECSVCDDLTTDLKDVLGALTPGCMHDWTVIICKRDLETYLATRMAPTFGRVSTSIQCWGLDCHQIIPHHIIQTQSTKPAFEAYDTALLHQTIHAGESFAECSTPACRGGGWVDSFSNVTYFLCELCHRATCIEHNGPYAAHAGKPCPATAGRRAQTEREQKRRAKEEKASEKVLKKTAQLGPCGHWVSKIDGCNHMTCTQCGCEFCYLCGANYINIRLVGNSAHKPTCKNYSKIRH